MKEKTRGVRDQAKARRDERKGFQNMFANNDPKTKIRRNG